MNDKIDFFENGEYRLITNLINDRIENLKKYKDFNTKYTKLYDLIDEIDDNMSLDELMSLYEKKFKD